MVVSDALNCFRAVTSVGCTHQPVVVGTQRKSTEMACFRWVNTLIGNLKTSIDGTYHGVKFSKYAHRYLAEAQYRFNRRYDLASLFQRLIFAGAQTGPRPENWLRLAED